MNDLGKKMAELISRSGKSLRIYYNEHRSYLCTVEQYFQDMDQEREIIPDDVYKKMVELDTCIMIQSYPGPGNSFVHEYHYDFETLIDKIIDEIDLCYGKKDDS